MARYKYYFYNQSKLIPIRYSEQILPGSFKFALSNIVDRMDMSIFETRYKNDETGAPAIDPAIMLKIVLYAYSRGITSSRPIERACRGNVIFMALSADEKNGAIMHKPQPRHHKTWKQTISSFKPACLDFPH